MPDTIDFSGNLAPLNGLLNSLAADLSAPARARALKRLRRLQVQGDAHLKRHTEELANLYREAVQRNSQPEELAQVEAILAEKERSAAEILVPGIEMLQQNLAMHDQALDPELQEAFQASINIALAWLANYRGTREALLRLALERRTNADEVLRARPVKGKVDHAALSREFMARFPKIRAALAK